MIHGGISIPSVSACCMNILCCSLCWLYSFFKPNVTVEVHNGHSAHFFSCSAKKCKTRTGGVWCYQDKADKSSTSNLHHHALHCFGEDTVNTAVKGEAGVSHSSNIFTALPIKDNGRKHILIMHTQTLSSGKHTTVTNTFL